MGHDEIDLLAGGPPSAPIDASTGVVTEVPLHSGTWPPDVVFHLRSGESAFHRYEKLGDPKSLKEATTAFYSALNESQRSANPDYEVWALSYLAACNFRRFEMLGEDSNLHESIAHFRAALNIESPKRPSHWLVANLANALHRLYGRRHDYGILEESVQTYRRALNKSEDTDRARLWVNYCRTLVQCYDDLGDRARLDEAHELLSGAATSAKEPIRVYVIVDLGNVKLRKYGWSGQIAYLDQSIELFDSALESDVRIDYLMVLNNLGNALRARYERLGDANDLDRAIEALEVSFAPAVEGEDSVRRRALSLGNALIDRSLKRSNSEGILDLERAISILRSVANITSNLQPEKANLLVTLGRALNLYARTSETEQRTHYADAVEVLRLAEGITSAPLVRRDISLHLGYALLPLGGSQEISSGLRHLTEALYSTPPSDPLHQALSEEISEIREQYGFENTIPNLPSSSVVQIWLNPKSDEQAHKLSSQAMYLQQYLNSMDTDYVKALIEREPAPFKKAEDVPEAGALVVQLRTVDNLNTLVRLIQWWANQHARDVTLKLLDTDRDSEPNVFEIGGRPGSPGYSARISRRRVG
ncbi:MULTISPECIES: tetratricopeptide repeat protein [Nocardia]|uniref:tetratricopeptide repeat protein n=1 Tax=Nocardia TaxID=1817 RepID=UPI0012D770CD|nr:MULTISPECIES: hypothetical protein [Nocardia]MBF6278694.1 hypothetical protein [Nocardia nova]